MRDYLSNSLSSSANRNKLNGLLAEVALRKHLADCGFRDRVSAGGWIARSDARTGEYFGKNTVVFFPQKIEPDTEYLSEDDLPIPGQGLHTICSRFHEIGVKSYFCAAKLPESGDTTDIRWFAKQLGIPTDTEYAKFPECLDGFAARERRYNFLRYKGDVSGIPDEHVADEFSKENARIAFQNQFMAEVVDMDGLFWGREITYPIEIKEKTVAEDKLLGEYFGLDLGPFVKLAYFASKRGNFNSMFIVREINNTVDRDLVQWWYITFERVAQCASWIPRGGGTNMKGGGSTVVMIPKAYFLPLDKKALESL